MKWEYKTDKLAIDNSKYQFDIKKLERQLNQHGKDKWELVNAVIEDPTHNFLIMIFKRPLD